MSTRCVREVETWCKQDLYPWANSPQMWDNYNCRSSPEEVRDMIPHWGPSLGVQNQEEELPESWVWKVSRASFQESQKP